MSFEESKNSAPQAHQQDTNRIIGSNVRLGTEMPVGLLDDVARRNGVGDDDEGWREGCESCMRRTAKRGGRVVMMQPPAVIVFECEYLIEP